LKVVLILRFNISEDYKPNIPFP